MVGTQLQRILGERSYLECFHSMLRLKHSLEMALIILVDDFWNVQDGNGAGSPEPLSPLQYYLPWYPWYPFGLASWAWEWEVLGHGGSPPSSMAVPVGIGRGEEVEP